MFAGGGATEAADAAGPSPEAQAAVSKRLLLGGAATLALAAFAMVPTSALRLKPQKPLYFYLVQLLSAQVSLSCAVVDSEMAICMQAFIIALCSGWLQACAAARHRRLLVFV